MKFSSFNLEAVANFGGSTIYRSPDGTLATKSMLEVDADGSPHAYNPENSGLDYLGNAGSPGDWWGIVTDNLESDGDPVIQGKGEPAEGYYVSCTSLQASGVDPKTPAAWVNSEEIPFIVIPGGSTSRDLGWKVGDIGTVVNLSTDVYCHVIVGDTGPAGQFGEGSIALAAAIGIDSSPKHGGTDSGIGYLVYPGSGNGQPRTVEEINRIGSEKFAPIQASVTAHLRQAPESDLPVDPPAAPQVTAPSPEKLITSLQSFLNEFPGNDISVDGIAGGETSAALERVLGFPFPGHDATPDSPTPFVVYATRYKSAYARLLEGLLNEQSGTALDEDGYAGADTSSAVRAALGSYLIGDPRSGPTGVKPTIPYDPAYFSEFAAALQEELAAEPGSTLKPDGYPGRDTSDALFASTGSYLAYDPEHR